jgi:putative transposase
MQQERERYPIELLCRVLKLWRAGYYARLRDDGGKRARSDAKLTEEIRRGHAEHKGRYERSALLRAA